MSDARREKIELTCAALIFNGRKLLLIKRTKEPWAGLWHFPGGHVDFGELPQESVVRELKEEAGLDVEIVGGGRSDSKGEFRVLKKPLGLFYYTVRDHHHMSFLFHCKAKQKRIRQSRKWAHEGVVAWVNPSNVETTPYVRKVLKSIMNKEK